MIIYGNDQSLTGYGHVILQDGQVKFIETIDTKKVKDQARVEVIKTRFIDTLTRFTPDVIVFENYAFNRGKGQTNNLTKLAEMLGVLRQECFYRGYSNNREDLRTPGKKVVMFQTQSTMKKFMLGDGSTKKDDSYLATVTERVKCSFPDDNQADAYMHARMADLVISVLHGQIPISNLTDYQQETLYGGNLTKGMSFKKALKLSDAEKLRLIEL